MAGSIQIELPANITIGKVQSIQESLEVLLDDPDLESVHLCGRSVERVDTAGVQLLLAFAKDAQERSLRVQWLQASEKLRSAVGQLGLHGVLSI